MSSCMWLYSHPHTKFLPLDKVKEKCDNPIVRDIFGVLSYPQRYPRSLRSKIMLIGLFGGSDSLPIIDGFAKLYEAPVVTISAKEDPLKLIELSGKKAVVHLQHLKDASNDKAAIITRMITRYTEKTLFSELVMFVDLPITFPIRRSECWRTIQPEAPSEHNEYDIIVNGYFTVFYNTNYVG